MGTEKQKMKLYRIILSVDDTIAYVYGKDVDDAEDNFWNGEVVDYDVERPEQSIDVELVEKLGD